MHTKKHRKPVSNLFVLNLGSDADSRICRGNETTDNIYVRNSFVLFFSFNFLFHGG